MIRAHFRILFLITLLVSSPACLAQSQSSDSDEVLQGEEWIRWFADHRKDAETRELIQLERLKQDDSKEHKFYELCIAEQKEVAERITTILEKNGRLADKIITELRPDNPRLNSLTAKEIKEKFATVRKLIDDMSKAMEPYYRWNTRCEVMLMLEDFDEDRYDKMRQIIDLQFENVPKE